MTLILGQVLDSMHKKVLLKLKESQSVFSILDQQQNVLLTLRIKNVKIYPWDQGPMIMMIKRVQLCKKVKEIRIKLRVLRTLDSLPVSKDLTNKYKTSEIPKLQDPGHMSNPLLLIQFPKSLGAKMAYLGQLNVVLFPCRDQIRQLNQGLDSIFIQGQLVTNNLLNPQI